MLKIRTRYGDGTPLELSEAELRQDLENGTADAAECGNVPPLSKEELKSAAWMGCRWAWATHLEWRSRMHMLREWAE